MRLVSLALSGLWVASATGSALAFCSKPSAPYCASSFGSFDDQSEFDGCRREMESYQSDVNDFIECNNDEAQEAIDQAKDDNAEAVSEYETAVDDFNRRAKRSD